MITDVKEYKGKPDYNKEGFPPRSIQVVEGFKMIVDTHTKVIVVNFTTLDPRTHPPRKDTLLAGLSKNHANALGKALIDGAKKL